MCWPPLTQATRIKQLSGLFEDIIDPAMLPCNHSFCWQCFASCAMQGSKNCTLCRTEQSLEPVNIEIETTLGCFAQDCYPMNQPEIPRPDTPSSEQGGGPGSQSQLSEFQEEKPPKLSKHEPQGPNPDLTAFLSPPSTPRARHQPEEWLSPPPAPFPFPAAEAYPPLLKALESNSISQVRRVLEGHAEAAQSVFLEHRFEPPLCACIRLECGIEITRLLLEKHAEVDWQDCDGYTPLALLSKKPYGYQPTAFDFEKFQVTVNSQEQAAMRVAQVLLASGANPAELAPGGMNCVELAQAAGNNRLACLLLGDAAAADNIEEERLQVWNTGDILAAELPLLYEPTPQILAGG